MTPSWVGLVMVNAETDTPVKTVRWIYHAVIESKLPGSLEGGRDYRDAAGEVSRDVQYSPTGMGR